MIPLPQTPPTPEKAERVIPTFGVPDYGPTPPDMPIPDRLNLFLVALVFSGCVALLWLGSQLTAWYSVLLVGIAFSYLMLTNYALLHEASHGNLQSNARLNYLSGVITGLLFPIPFRLMRTTHQNHHNHNRTDHEMFDLYYPSDNRFLKFWQWYNLLCGMFWPLIPIGSVLFALFPGILRWQMLRGANPGSRHRHRGQPGAFCHLGDASGTAADRGVFRRRCSGC